MADGPERDSIQVQDSLGIMYMYRFRRSSLVANLLHDRLSPEYF